MRALEKPAAGEAGITDRNQMVSAEIKQELIDNMKVLRAFAISLTRDASRADDLVQETVMKAWTNIHSFTPGTNMRAWLFTILRNTFYSERRKAKREVSDEDGEMSAQLATKPEHDGRLQFKDFRAAFQQLPHHHDALRLRFTPNEAGWRQTLPTEVAPVPVKVISMKHVTSAERDAFRQQAASQLAASLNLQNGPLMAVAIFSAETDAPLQAFITIHHLAVDAVSWRPLLEDVERATRQIQRGETVRLPAKTTSF